MSNPEGSPGAQSPVRRIFSNVRILLKARGISGILLFASTALMARALGPVEFGLVVLMQTYVQLVRGLLGVKQVQVIIRYGVPAYDAGDIRALRRLIRICRRMDHYASITATLVAVGMAPLIGPAMGIDQDHVYLLTAYSLVLLTSGNLTFIGILRLFDQFKILGRTEMISPVIRFFGVVIAWWLESPLPVYIAILALAYGTGSFYLMWCGRREYRQRIGPAPEGESIGDARIAEFSGLRHFLWVTYWQSNLDLIPKRGSIILAGYFLGPSDAGLLRLARQFSTLLAKPAVLIRQVAFLDLTRSWNQGSTDFTLVAYRTALLGASVGMVFVLAGYFFGDALLDTLIGEEFAAAAPVLTLLLLAATFELANSSLRAAAYAIGHTSKVLHLSLLSTVIYMSLFVVLTSQMGLIGAGVAACVAAALPPLAMVIIIRQSTR